MLKQRNSTEKKSVKKVKKVSIAAPIVEEKTVMMPITKLSYSSMMQLLRNPLIFKMKYVFKIFTSNSGVSAMVGRACHEALRFYYGGNPDMVVPIDIDEARGEAKAVGLDYLDKYPDGGIKYGKTGTRESMLKTYQQAIDFYFAEEPEYHEVILSEQKLEAEIRTKDGDLLPLPAVAIPDLVVRNLDGSYDIIDTKFVGSFTETESEDYTKIIQAKFLDHVLKGARDIQASRVIFREIKTSLNKDGGGQMRDYVIPLDHQAYDIIFYNLYKDIVKFISNPNAVYLPNLSDNFDGEESGLVYAQGLINADMSDVEVMHKVKDVVMTHKKFVASRVELVENKNLLPSEKIKMKLGEFGIPIEPEKTVVGASVTQYRFKVSAGVRMTTFAKHKADIAKVLEAKSEIRILAPIPGTSLVGIEVPNEERTAAILDRSEFEMGTLMLPIGQDVNGKVVKTNLAEMPHLLIAGSTNSGKSVLLHSLITTLTTQMNDKDMQLVLIDPKRVELIAFAKVPHLQGRKIIYEYEDALRALLNLVDVMEERYKILETHLCRNIEEYHACGSKMPYIVVVFDEFADFIYTSKIALKSNKQKSYSSRSLSWLKSECNKRGIIALGLHDDMTKKEAQQHLIEWLEIDDEKDELKRGDADVEMLITRLAQMARAVGIHLIIATQRPSVDVITGLIKANFPTRIALTCASPTDSIVILGEPGAEKLNGKGDMLYSFPGNNGKLRLQGFKY